MKKVVLTFDGGALRGVVQLRILKHIEELLLAKNVINPGTNRPIESIMECIDIAGGSSVGGLLSAILTVSKDGKYLYSLDNVIKIFATVPESLEKQFLGFLFKPHFSNDKLSTFLSEKFKDLELSDLNKNKLILSSFSIKSGEQTIWTNIKVDEDVPGVVRYVSDAKLSDAVMSSCVGISHFNPHDINGDSEVDYGMFRNNPLLDIISTIMKSEETKVDFKNLFVLSIGAGTRNMNLESIGNASPLNCLKSFAFGGENSLMDVLIEHNKKSIKDHMGNVITSQSGKFFSVEPFFTDIEKFNDSLSVENIPYFEQVTDDYIANNQPLLQDIVDSLIDFIQM